MRRGSSSGPSDVTTNATSTFAASVCSSDVRPAACRTIALRRGSTVRISPSARPTQSPTATSRFSCSSRPGRRVRTRPAGRLDVVGGAMRRHDPSRHEAGLQLFGELGSSTRARPDRTQATQNLLRDVRRGRRGGRLPRGATSVARLVGRSGRGGGKHSRHVVEPPLAGDGNLTRLGTSPPSRQASAPRRTACAMCETASTRRPPTKIH